jgi:hypothetical protein
MEISQIAYTNSWFTKKNKGKINKYKNSWIEEQISKDERINIEFRPN